MGGNDKKRNIVFGRLGPATTQQQKSVVHNESKNDQDGRLDLRQTIIDKSRSLGRNEQTEKLHERWRDRGYDLEEIIDQADSPFAEEIMREKGPSKIQTSCHQAVHRLG